MDMIPVRNHSQENSANRETVPTTRVIGNKRLHLFQLVEAVNLDEMYDHAPPYNNWIISDLKGKNIELMSPDFDMRIEVAATEEKINQIEPQTHSNKKPVFGY